MKRYTVPEVFSLMGGPYSADCRHLYFDHLEVFKTAYGATNNHQAWPGGFHDHLEEVLNIAIVLHQALKQTGRELPSLSDALLGLFIHDLEKPWAYKWSDNRLVRKPEFQDKTYTNKFRRSLVERYGIILSDRMWDDIYHVEGDVDYTNQRRVSSPRASFMHLCDHASARMWPQHPQLRDEPWGERVSP